MMETSVSVRRASGADMPQLAPLGIEHAAFERLPHRLLGGGDALVAALDATPPRLYAWLAENADQVVGYATASIDFSTLSAAPYLHLDCLFVREGWRGRAIGRRLWLTARDFALACGCRDMQWQTPAWNADAARFYLRLGAHESHKRRYVLDLDPSQTEAAPV